MAYHQLTQEERYLISAATALRRGIREIARDMNRSPGTISREIRRNATTGDRRYRAEKAHSYAVARRRRARRGSQFGEAIYREVDAALGQRLSPEQIVGLLRSQRREVPSHDLPKRTCLKHLTQDQCDKIANALNTRPRKRHHFKSPQQIYTRS